MILACFLVEGRMFNMMYEIKVCIYLNIKNRQKARKASCLF